MKTVFYYAATFVLFCYCTIILASMFSTKYTGIPTKYNGHIVVAKYDKTLLTNNALILMNRKDGKTKILFSYDILYNKVNVGDTVK